MIRAGIHLAETEEEKEAVYRFRYDVYVEEMGVIAHKGRPAREHLVQHTAPRE